MQQLNKFKFYCRTVGQFIRLNIVIIQNSVCDAHAMYPIPNPNVFKTPLCRTTCLNPPSQVPLRLAISFFGKCLWTSLHRSPLQRQLLQNNLHTKNPPRSFEPSIRFAHACSKLCQQRALLCTHGPTLFKLHPKTLETLKSLSSTLHKHLLHLLEPLINQVASAKCPLGPCCPTLDWTSSTASVKHSIRLLQLRLFYFCSS